MRRRRLHGKQIAWEYGGRAPAPLFSKARGGLASLLLPPALSRRISGKPDMRAEGMERREALTWIAPCGARRLLRETPAPRGAPSRCHYGSRAALLAADPLSRVALTISKLLAAGLIAGGRSPGAARARRVRPPPAAGTASVSHHRDASRRRPRQDRTRVGYPT